MTENSKKPVKVFKAGGVKASIWENKATRDGKEQVFPSIQIDRTYKDGEGFGHTSSFGVRDLPRAVLVAQKAFEWLSLDRDDANGGE